MIVAFVVLLSAAVDVARGTLLPINQHRPCMATFNGSLALDLEPFFQWPVRAQFVPGNAPGGYYSYEYDCAGKRTVCGPGVAVCQIRNDHITFEAGGSPLKALWFSGTYSPIPQVSLEIRYPVRLLPKQLLFAGKTSIRRFCMGSLARSQSDFLRMSIFKIGLKGLDNGNATFMAYGEMPTETVSRTASAPLLSILTHPCPLYFYCIVYCYYTVQFRHDSALQQLPELPAHAKVNTVRRERCLQKCKRIARLHGHPRYWPLLL